MLKIGHTALNYILFQTRKHLSVLHVCWLVWGENAELGWMGIQ